MKKFLVSLLLFSISNLASAAEKKEWTFLVFINGNNSLDEFGAQNINQMEAIGSSENLNIVVEWASLQRQKTYRLLVQKDSDPAKVNSPMLEDLGNPDMGDYRTLEEFAKWAVEKYPAKRYFLNVWNHGSGWRYMRGMAKEDKLHLNDISWDDNTGHAITTKQLGLAVENISKVMGQKLDVFGSDACLMGMVEIAGEMKNHIQYYVGSQDLEPGAGWPYDKFLAHFVDKPDISPREASIALTEEYYNHYEGEGRSSDVTFSAYDMSHYPALNEAIKKLGQEITKLPAAEKNHVAMAVRNTQSFDYDDYGDLTDFLKKLGASKVASIDPRSISDTAKAAAEFIVINRASDSFPNANGISIWLPKDKRALDMHSNKYKDLLFNTDTQWLNALAAFTK